VSIRYGSQLWHEMRWRETARAERERDEALEQRTPVEGSPPADVVAESKADDEADAQLLAEIAEIGAELELGARPPGREAVSALPDEVAEAIVDAVDEAVSERLAELEIE
jgi:hypothetical protein